MQDRIRLHVRNYRAIKEADIELANLTILAGVNSSGKSTLARLFHRLICIASDYDAYVVNEVHRRFRDAIVRPLLKIYTSNVRNRKAMLEVERLASVKSRMPQNFGTFLEYLRNTLNRLLSLAEDVVNDSRFAEAFDAYIPESYSDVPRMKGKGDVTHWVDEVCRYFELTYTKMVRQAAGSSSLFFDADVGGESLGDIGNIGREGALFQNIQSDEPKMELAFFDGGNSIVDVTNPALPMGRVFSLRQSFYIARPSVDFPSVFSRKLRLNGIDYRISTREPNSEAINGRGGSIGVEALIGGRIAAPKGKNYVAATDWLFSDGKNAYNLEQCADGIKSLASLAILHDYGLLEVGSLLIIDEPEVHLHPQWVVGMAGILVRLSKERGVKVLITTHSPDLVHAIRDFSENAGYAENTCFYLSNIVNSGDAGYTYQKLEMDIGPIFSVFNVAKQQIYAISKFIREGRPQ